ncbi:MAG: Nif3-like dinuclear metal center hexameric protein [Lachnospiraceae bacterium]|nr:Nif3-like dinuclear metal center hexameric protein [Lachnospiraceae bacterium]MBP5275177.1 Nif3-like dinuclear metal center hexameric protein [Lachnospiraceae bacterium]MBP5565555.1 Nif3-like dinuclear metal center hexameric protein [Lachnospiraceae bacterium]
MILKDIYKCLDRIAPFEYKEDWDNSGLLIGDWNKDVSRIMVVLDVTNEVVAAAVQANVDLIISHHPLIFEPIKQLNTDDLTASKVLKLANNNIAYIAMHTNMDATGLGEVADEILGIKREEVLWVNINYNDPKIGMGSIGKFVNENKEEVNITLRDAVIRTKEGFQADVVKVYGDLDRVINKVAVCTGSGKSLVDTAIEKGCDLFITGDINYHTGLDAAERGLALIDISHYTTEIVFIDILSAFFAMNLPDLTVIPFSVPEAGTFM